MQRQMSFLETPRPDGATPPWALLADELRAEIVTVLARLIAKVVEARDADEEKEDE